MTTDAHARGAARCAKRHASIRFRVALTSRALARLVDDIEGGRARRLWSQSESRSWHLVRLGAQDAVAVYDVTTRAIHTFLRLEDALAKLRTQGIPTVELLHQEAPHDALP
ncbi:hypothetical protein LXT21_29515 [Myxococcus sp. K38C18041901]|uniref:hypothetical protein n=1 Tax=Myxococcus guangdongensis TaxID=2906760 RepID=UPI0020A71C98|nr:hypothetical protein [Myxococcus guangdongensis]MCP3062930.1 hypothetical protein [Myxococcus guangdongensis]